ncbi:carbohydrate kinase family protein [Sneathiella glossodoripedis]|uniref:carbohydrate kinase family protein n=1 Tax=Sneathiella glossodoripedis TaxID=418853 RepID=UPI000472CE97|nr:carbohydrate kinase family protein [Sneathiella glossodoripedis]
MKITVVGGATIDVIATIDPSDIESVTMRNAANSYLLMEQGAKVEATHIDTQMGGGATNASVSMARLGGDVRTVLMLGNDRDAEHVLDRLKSENVDTSYVMRHPTEPTGKSVIICSHDRNAGVFVNRGSNSCLSGDDLTMEMFEGSDLVYVSTLSAQSADAFPQIVRMAKEAGAFVVCNPGIRQIRQRKDQVLDALQWVDMIAINRDEASALAQGTVTLCNNPPALDPSRPDLINEGLGEKGAFIKLADLSRLVAERGSRFLVVTNGAEGAYLTENGEIHFCPTIPAKLESTIGAGDAFNSTLAFALVAGKAFDEAMRWAVTNAASVAGYVDAQTGLLTQEELQKRL